MKPIFITATNTNVGKTYATTHLIKYFSKKNIKVGVFKPIETGVDKKFNDAEILLSEVKKYNKNFLNLKPKDITAYNFSLPASPFVADINKIIEIEIIIQKYNELQKKCDLLLIEGAGGLMVPILKNYFMIDLAKELNSNIFLITSSKLGSINDTLLSLNLLKRYSINFSWSVNLFEDKNSFFKITKPFYDTYFKDWNIFQDKYFIEK